MLTKMQAQPNSTMNVSNVKTLRNAQDLVRALSKAPFRIPLRTRLDVVMADKKLEDPTVMNKMAKTIASIVEYVKRLNSTKETVLVSNAIICRFDLAYFVVKRLTSGRHQKAKNPMDFINGRTCLPLHLCSAVSRLFTNALREVGVNDKRYS